MITKYHAIAACHYVSIAALPGILPGPAAIAVPANVWLNRRAKGIPFPDEWVISVLPSSGASAKRIVDALTARPGLGRFEVFPYGIINPEIGRIDIGIRG